MFSKCFRAGSFAVASVLLLGCDKSGNLQGSNPPPMVMPGADGRAGPPPGVSTFVESKTGFGSNNPLGDDVDGDGRLSRDEARVAMRSYFDQLDLNGDGFVTRAELDERDRRDIRKKEDKKQEETVSPAAETDSSKKSGDAEGSTPEQTDSTDIDTDPTESVKE